MIISYTESRDLLTAPEVSFPVPRSADGFTHVALLDGQLVGHWRVVRRGNTARIETRMARPLGHTERAALDAAVGRYERFAAVSAP